MRQHGEEVVPPAVNLLQRFLDALQLRNVHEHRAAVFPILGGSGLDVHEHRLTAFNLERDVAGFLGPAREDLLEESVKDAAGALGDEEPEPPPHQPGALQFEQARPGEIRLADIAFPAEGKVADRREVIELGVALQSRLQFRPRPLELLVLHLQLDLVHLQLVDEPLCVAGWWLPDLRARGSFPQPILRPAAQLGSVHRRAPALLHEPSSCPTCLRNAASSVLAAVMSMKVITTPSMRLS